MAVTFRTCADTLGGEIVRTYLKLANFLIGLTVAVAFPRPPSKKRRRILVFRTGGIGDLIAIVPALKYLRANGAENIWLLSAVSFDTDAARVGSSAVALLQAAELIDGVHYLDVNSLRQRSILSSLGQELRGLNSDSVLLLPYTGEGPVRTIKKLILLRLLGIKIRPGGWRIQSTLRIFRRAQWRRGGYENQAIVALKAAGYRGPTSEALRTYSCQLLVPDDAPGSEVGLPLDKRLLVVAASAKFEHKRWAQSSFTDVLTNLQLSERVHPVFIGGPSDYALSEQIKASLPGPSTNLCGRLSLTQTFALCRRATAYLGNDTGPAHIAAAAGIPTLTIFSGIHYPGVWDPWNERGKAIRREVACQPCLSEKLCPNGTRRCMTEIEPRQVTETLLDLLSRNCVPESAKRK